MSKEPLVSIIIPTYNAAQNIDRCLKSIYSQSYKNIEIIIVDQESSDDTLKIAKKYDPVIISREKPKFYSPPSASRNIGATKAKGSILYHLDSDMSLPQHFIQECIDLFNSHSEIGALVVHEKDMAKGYWSKAKALERRCYWENDSIESARVVRKEIFEKVKGYNEKINSGEDFDIHRRYKQVTKIGFANTPIEHHIGELHFFRLLSKKYSYGKTGDKYFQATQTSGFSLVKEQLMAFVAHIDLFIKNPLIGLGTLILKFAELSAGILGMIYQSLLNTRMK